jgi:hypothetical protein
MLFIERKEEKEFFYGNNQIPPDKRDTSYFPAHLFNLQRKNPLKPLKTQKIAAKTAKKSK